MNAQIELIEGTNRDVGLSQFFTPPELAAKVVEWAVNHHWPDGSARAEGPRGPLRVLEPSAGNGALVRPLVAAGAEVLAVELDMRYHAELEQFGCAVSSGMSFLGLDTIDTDVLVGISEFDLCVMNPPYENGLDVAFILHALRFAPRVVGIFTDRILFGVERKEGLWSQVRPTRIAFQSRRPFKGAQTDYVVAELVKRESWELEREPQTWGADVRLEWW